MSVEGSDYHQRTLFIQHMSKFLNSTDMSIPIFFSVT